MSLFDDMMASIGGGPVGALPPGAFPAPLPSEMEAAKADDAAARWAEKQRKEQAAALLAAQARQGLTAPPPMAPVAPPLQAAPDASSPAIQMALGNQPANVTPAPFSMAGPGQDGIPPSVKLAAQMSPPPPPTPPSAPPGAMPAQAPIPGLEHAPWRRWMPPPAAPPAPPPSPDGGTSDDTDVGARRRGTPGVPRMPMSIAGAASAAAAPSGMDRFGDALLGLGGALQGDRGMMTQHIIQQRQAMELQSQAQNFTAKALLAKGVDPTTVAAAVHQPEILKALVGEHFGKSKYKVTQTGEDSLGTKTFEAINENDPTDRIPLGPQGGGAAASGIGDMSKTGPEYLATVPAAHQKIIQGMVDGTIQPPSSFAMAKPYWRTMLAAAKNVDPSFDENTWAGRHKMTTDIAASGNSSMGGIISNGKSAFKHLAEYTDSAADLGNASHDFPGGGVLANAQNTIGNTMGGSNTKAKIKAINDNLGHYGQESTKFYAGTGGGVEERMNALKEMNPVSTSGEEMAAYANKEKGLMLDRLHEKEAQIRNTMGDAYLQKHPVFTKELQADIARIEGNVAKLRGEAPATPAAPGIPSLKVGESVKIGDVTIKKIKANP